MFLRRILPKVLKATVMGFLWFFLLYALPKLLLSELVEEVLPGFTQMLSTFAIVIVTVAVISELLAGTIFHYIFNIGKTLVLMAFFIDALNGGFIAFDLETIHIEADLRVFLAMLLVIESVGLVKSLLKATDFLAKKTERQLAFLD